jgi:integrase
MASIDTYTTQKGQTVYRFRIRRQGKAQTRIFLTKREATHWAQQQEGLLLAGLAGIPQKRQPYTLAEAFERYQREVFPRKKPSTARSQKYLLPFILRTLDPSTRLDAITPADIRKLCGALEAKGNTPATVVRNLVLLSHVFTVGIREWEWVTNNPVRVVTKPREPKGRERYLSSDEIQRLLLACKRSRSEHLHLIVLLALSSGARQGEILNLRWQDVDTTQGVLTFRNTKNSETREVSSVPADFLFPSPKNPQKPLSIRTAWERVINRAALDDVVFHTLRHTAGSHLAMSGTSLLDIATILGHRSHRSVKFGGKSQIALSSGDERETQYYHRTH